MRTAQELIAELDGIASSVEKAALVVSFETTTIFVWSEEADRLSQLTEAVMLGGMPIGFVVVRSAPEGEEFGMLSARPLQELSGEEWVKKMLTRILENVANLINSFKDRT